MSEDSTVTIVPHFAGKLVICPPGCIAIDPEIDMPEELDLPELLVQAPERELVVAADVPEDPHQALVIAVVGDRVDLRPMAERFAEAERRGERVEVHVFKEAPAVNVDVTPVPAP